MARITKEINLCGNVKYKLIRKQFRVLPAVARTLYRAQGKGIEEYGIDLTREGRETFGTRCQVYFRIAWNRPYLPKSTAGIP